VLGRVGDGVPAAVEHTSAILFTVLVNIETNVNVVAVGKL